MTNLHVPIEIVVDGANAGAFPFTACNGRACIVLIQNNNDFLNKLRTFDALKMTFKMFNGQGVAIDASLKGFKAAIDAMGARINVLNLYRFIGA